MRVTGDGTVRTAGGYFELLLASARDVAALPISEDAKGRILAGTADELFPPR